MPAQLVIGLFHSGGIALDAYHRLRTEGIPANRLLHRVLKETGTPPPNVETELEALTLDPLIWGDVRQTFAPLIHNGETAVFVDADDDREAGLAAEVLRLYNPIMIEMATSRQPPAAL